jgi:tRNA threonylcarbamoyladenosine biosynthesis protein TsaB
MKLLAFDTSTENMSIAVQRVENGIARVWQHAGAGAAQASASLIPRIQDLMREAGLGFEDLDAIAFGAGPGSFTGLRTACSVAQGLALGATALRQAGGGADADVKVLPVSTLLAVAEEARFKHGAQRVLVGLDARMDEVYGAAFEHDGRVWRQITEDGLLAPQALHLPPGFSLAGNAHLVYGERLALPPGSPVLLALPQAVAMLRLAPALLAAGHAVAADHAAPRYIRDKVAKTTSERAAEKAAR